MPKTPKPPKRPQTPKTPRTPTQQPKTPNKPNIPAKDNWHNIERTAAGPMAIEGTGAPPPIKPTPPQKKKTSTPAQPEQNPPLHRTDLGPRASTIPPRNLETYINNQIAWSYHCNKHAKHTRHQKVAKYHDHRTCRSDPGIYTSIHK